MNEADLEAAQGDREQMEERRSGVVYLLYEGSYADRILISVHETLAGAQAKAATAIRYASHGDHVWAWREGSYPLAKDYWSCTVGCLVEIEAAEVDA